MIIGYVKRQRLQPGQGFRHFPEPGNEANSNRKIFMKTNKRLPTVNTTTRRTFIGTGLAGLTIGSLIDRGVAAEPKILPKVLLIGDSVSIGYTNYIVGMMFGTMIIKRPMNKNGGYLNCEGTTSGTANLDTWLGHTQWDVIHFNFGLHDLKHIDPNTGRNSGNPDHPQQANLKQYEANLKTIVNKLKATKANLIFATTTPFPDKPGGPLRRSDQVEKYNNVARRIMSDSAILINDLHDFVLPRMEKLMPPNNVHFTEAGSLELAQQVVAHIKRSVQ